MQSKAANTIFYGLIIVFVVLCGVGTIFRYCADMNFDKARLLATAYGRAESRLTSWEEIKKLKLQRSAHVNHYYSKAIDWNILETENYAKMIKHCYFRALLK